MNFYVNLVRFFFPIEDHLYRLLKAERIKNLWKVCFLLFFISIVIYSWMAMLGIGSDLISGEAISLNQMQYEASKVWYVIGRAGYGLLFAVIMIFIPALLLYSVTDVSFRKLLIMQELVFFIMLLERILWIPFMVFLGLDWYVSPLSFGIIASYFTAETWIIFFFGAISLVQLWIIWFQVRFLRYMSSVKKQWLWIAVILLHIIYWATAALVSFMDVHLIGGWFE